MSAASVSWVSLKIVRHPVPAEARECVRRWTGPNDAAPFVARLIEDEASEVFLVVMLNAKHTPIGVHVAGRGGIDHVPADAREVFRAAIVGNAAAIIVAHNHPSGDPEPSPQDVTLTDRLCQAGTILGIPVLDHLVIGEGGRFVSLCARGTIAA